MAFPYLAPGRTIDALRNEMSRLVSEYAPHAADLWAEAGARGQPALNVWDEGDALAIEAELPGVRTEDLELSVVENELTLKVGVLALEEEGVTYHRRERPIGQFTRVVRLPSSVDASCVSADLRNGVLLVRLPKAEHAKPRRIQVQVAK